jgi:uncharacterized membrane protein YfcA
MVIAGYIAAAFIGISLGLIGGGGSILTVPVLVYLFGLQPLLATSYSLFIVGSTSLVGAVNNYRKGWVNVRTALLFGSASVLTVFIARKWLLPRIPEQLFRIGDFVVTSSLMTMVLFAILMLAASMGMIRKRKFEQKKNILPASLLRLLTYGIGIGLVTGFLGAGGGFLLIPALVLLVGLPMRQAIGTSLLIIAMNALIGFTGDIGHFHLDWKLLVPLTLIAISGIFIGGAIGKKIPGGKLRKGFGWFILLMSVAIILTETVFK